MRLLKIGLLSSALLVGASAAHTQDSYKGPKAPQALAIIGCRVDDVTGQPGRQDPTMAANGWRDLELHLNKDGEVECKREVVPLEDAALFGGGNVMPLNPNFGDHFQCARAGMFFSPKWEEAHKGWAVVVVGCPTPIKNDKTGDGPTEDDPIIGWKMPECPAVINGKAIKCNFDESTI